MTSFDDMMKTGGTPAIDTTFGDPVTYNPLGVAGSTITGTFQEMEEVHEETDGVGKTIIHNARFNASPDAIASPDERDTLTIGGVVWAVDLVLQRKPVVKLDLVRREKLRIGGHIDKSK